QGRPWLRDRASRDLAPEEAERRARAGEPSAIRFRVPDGDGATRFEDAVYGPQERAHRDIEDFALLRPDGTPLYNHVVVCDDREIFTTEELVQAFGFPGISRSNAILNFSETDPRQWTDRKALFLNQQYMAKMPLEELLPRVEDVLGKAGLWDEAFVPGGNRR